jgi:hypothetical protein
MSNAKQVSTVTSLDFGDCEEKELLKKEVLNEAKSFDSSFEKFSDSANSDFAEEENSSTSYDCDSEIMDDEYDPSSTYWMRNKNRIVVSSLICSFIIAVTMWSGSPATNSESAVNIPVPILPSAHVDAEAKQEGNGDNQELAKN